MLQNLGRKQKFIIHKIAYYISFLGPRNKSAI